MLRMFCENRKIKKALSLAVGVLLLVLIVCGTVTGVVLGLMHVPQTQLKEGNNADKRILMSPADYKAYIFKRGDQTFAYRLREPLTASKENAPLLIYLHGNGAQGDDNRMQMDASFYNMADKFATECFVFVPQCGEGGRWDDYTFNDYTKIINDCIDNYIIKNYTVDKNRIYVTGVSMGGFGTANQIETYRDRYAAAMIVCGGSNKGNFDHWANLPVWIAHGDADNIVSVENARAIRAALDEIGNRVYRYTEYPGFGHGIAEIFYKNPAVWEWMLNQKLS